MCVACICIPAILVCIADVLIGVRVHELVCMFMQSRVCCMACLKEHADLASDLCCLLLTQIAVRETVDNSLQICTATACVQKVPNWQWQYKLLLLLKWGGGE